MISTEPTRAQFAVLAELERDGYTLLSAELIADGFMHVVWQMFPASGTMLVGPDGDRF